MRTQPRSPVQSERVLGRLAVGLTIVGLAVVILAAASGAVSEPSSDPSPPRILEVGVLELTPQTASITWTVDRPVTGQVEYGTTLQYGSFTTLEPSFRWSTHIQDLTGLQPGTTYYYRVISMDEQGADVTSEGHTFTTPKPTPTPDLGGKRGVYGPLVSATDLNNTRIGYDHTKASYRFRAERSSRLESIRIYIVAGKEGYAAGTGGTLRITVRPDDGSAEHWPTGKVLAKRDVARPTGGAGNLYTFSSPPLLEAGRLYHIVFENIDADPTRNYVSLDGIFQFSVPGSADPWQHGYANTDWAQLTKRGSADWTIRATSTITPIMELAYADGAHQGMGYIEFWVNAPSQTKTISGAQDKARERFTVSGGDRSIGSVSVRIKRVHGSAPLKIRLEKGNGDLIEKGTVVASAIPMADPSDKKKDATWVTYTFDTRHTLQDGKTYDLVFSTDSSTAYNLAAMREGESFGYHPASYFADGSAQETSDGGATWVAPFAWTNRNPEGDWQFYFTRILGDGGQ